MILTRDALSDVSLDESYTWDEFEDAFDWKTGQSYEGEFFEECICRGRGVVEYVATVYIGDSPVMRCSVSDPDYAYDRFMSAMEYGMDFDHDEREASVGDFCDEDDFVEHVYYDVVSDDDVVYALSVDGYVEWKERWGDCVDMETLAKEASEHGFSRVELL